MERKQTHKLLTAMRLFLLFKTKRILKHAAANHNTIYPCFFDPFKPLLAVGDIAIANNERLRSNSITQGNNFFDFVPVGGYVAHFFLRAAMYRKRGNVLL